METAPRQNEIEISVLGPGYGECILIHIGSNHWFVIDSCIKSGETNPAALDYFDLINVDPSNAVKLVIATHWHDDHIRGLGQIFQACTNATFICSEALKCDEFLNLIRIYGADSSIETSGSDEFQTIIEELKKREKEKNGAQDILKFAVADRPLWNSSVEDDIGVNCSAHSLSPNDSALLASRLEFANIFPENISYKNNLPMLHPNQTAVVLLIEVEEFSILLGADLEENKKHESWSIIINSKTRPQNKASFYKIAHHGSQNGDHPKIWDELLVKNPVAVLTPFSKGSVFLPTKQDIKRICSNTNEAYTTSPPGRKKRLKRDNRTVEKTIRETVGKKINLKNPFYGHVRFRIQPGQKGQVELFNDAEELCSNT